MINCKNIFRLSVYLFTRCDTYHSLDDLSKDHVFAVQPAGLVEEDEELGPVGVHPVVRHGHVPRGLVAELEVLVHEGWSVNTLSC